MKQIQIDINLAVVMFFLVGIMVGFLMGMLVQNAIIMEYLGAWIENIGIENVHFEINQTKLVQDLWEVYNASA